MKQKKRLYSLDALGDDGLLTRGKRMTEIYSVRTTLQLCVSWMKGNS